jgi:hypothetical protein
MHYEEALYQISNLKYNMYEIIHCLELSRTK